VETTSAPFIELEAAAPVEADLVVTDTPAEPAVESRKERRERILDELSRRVDIFSTVYDDIQNIQPGLTNEEARDHFEALKQKWMSLFSDKALAGVERLREIAKQPIGASNNDLWLEKMRLDADEDVSALYTMPEIAETMLEKY